MGTCPLGSHFPCGWQAVAQAYRPDAADADQWWGRPPATANIGKGVGGRPEARTTHQNDGLKRREDIMIVHQTLIDTHVWNVGLRRERKRERLRERAEAFIANRVNEEDVINITESGDEYASSVTVWFKGR